MTSIAQLIKASEYACTGRYPVQVSAMFLNELSNLFFSLFFSLPVLPSTPTVLSRPRLEAATAPAAMVFTLLGARGQSARTGPQFGYRLNMLIISAIIIILILILDIFEGLSMPRKSFLCF